MRRKSGSESPLNLSELGVEIPGAKHELDVRHLPDQRQPVGSCQVVTGEIEDLVLAKAEEHQHRDLLHGSGPSLAERVEVHRAEFVTGHRAPPLRSSAERRPLTRSGAGQTQATRTAATPGPEVSAAHRTVIAHHMARTRRWADASSRAVWEVLADGWSYSSWVVGTWRIRGVDPDWPRPGSQLHHAIGIWPALVDDVTTVLAAEPCRRLVLRARGWPIGDARVEIALRDDSRRGCRITMRENATGGPARLIPGPLRAVGLLPRNSESLRRLADLAEEHE